MHFVFPCFNFTISSIDQKNIAIEHLSALASKLGRVKESVTNGIKRIAERLETSHRTDSSSRFEIYLRTLEQEQKSNIVETAMTNISKS